MGTEVFECLVLREILVNHASWSQKAVLVLTEHACNTISLIILTTAGSLPDSHEFTKSQSLVTPAMLRLFLKIDFGTVMPSPSSLTLYFTELVPHKSNLPRGFAGPIRVRIQANRKYKEICVGLAGCNWVCKIYGQPEFRKSDGGRGKDLKSKTVTNNAILF
jgi:hypothetical protein